MGNHAGHRAGRSTASLSAVVFVSWVVLSSLALTMILAFIAALPRAVLMIVLEVASACVAGTVALVLARKRRFHRTPGEGQPGGAGLR